MSDKVACPLCGREYPASEIAVHADGCTGEETPSPRPPSAAPEKPKPQKQHQQHHAEPKPAEEDSDLALALKLQAEFDAEQQSARKTVRCEICRENVKVEDVYVLDDCSHRFCRPCIEKHVAEKIATSVAIACPVAGCGKPLSVRDSRDIVPKAIAIAKATPLSRGASSKRATARIASELRHITESKPEKNGFSVEIVDDNVYEWEVKFMGFDKEEPIAQDMAAMHVKEIVMRVTFTPEYPFAPPFCRILRPRFAFRTGHVTLGGSICNEVLTRKGWSPENTVEAVIVSIRSSFLSGGARLDRASRGVDYTLAEAKQAYDRLVAQHGWG